MRIRRNNYYQKYQNMDLRKRIIGLAVDEFTEKEAKKERASQGKIYEKMEKEYINISKDIAVLKSKIDSDMKQLEEKYQRTELIPRSQITDLAFKNRSQLILTAMSKRRRASKNKLKRRLIALIITSQALQNLTILQQSKYLLHEEELGR